MEVHAWAGGWRMLTRDMLVNGAFLASFPDQPGMARWSRQQIDESMHEALAQRPAAQPVWLFAYGSLIWNPLIEYEEKQHAVLHGWHRSFSLRLQAGRATPEAPGRMLALDAGGESAGVAFRLAEDHLQRELGLVWIREMVYGSYRPIWGKTRLADGRTVAALTFVADTARDQHEADASIATTAPLIAQACGSLGSNRDYLLSLDETLAEHGIDDPYIHDLARTVRALPVVDAVI